MGKHCKLHQEYNSQHTDPKQYMKKNRYQKAYTSLLRLRFHPIQAARDLYYIHCQLQIEASIVGKSNYVTRFIQLFTIPRVRRATLASFTVMIAQQMVRAAYGEHCDYPQIHKHC